MISSNFLSCLTARHTTFMHVFRTRPTSIHPLLPASYNRAKSLTLRPLPLFLACSLALNGGLLQADELTETANQPASQSLRLPDPATQLPLDDLRKFTEVFDRIKKTYVEEVDDRTLLNNAIKGMLSGLDPHSAYLEASAFEDLQENTSGQFGGLGIEVGMENGFVRVITPIDDTPAQKAGVEPGDLIIKLDDKPVKGMSLDDAVNMMRGKPGSKIVLTIVRESETAPIEITVIRDIIKVTSVKSATLEPGIGYVRITQFQASTGDDFSKTITKLKAENNGKIDGLVLDLRNNPGGVLQAAVAVCDALLNEGLIVYTEGRIKSSQLRFSATPGDELDQAPVVVLINGGSASASEIVAGALQDQRRAVVMGTQSFGKGSVQTVMQLTEENGLKLTTARYFTPGGRSIQALGIVPDIEVKRGKFTELESQAFYKEADLAGHLMNDKATDGSGPSNDKNKNESKGKKGQSDKKKAIEPSSELPDSDSVEDSKTPWVKDFQLREALNLIKGLKILGTKVPGRQSS